MIVKVVEKDVMDPVAETGDHKIELNKVDPDFKKLALFNNTKPGADVILDYLGENLGKSELIRVKKPAGAPATQNQLEEAALGELVILALGDCGSCSSWVILDAIRLEKLGVPTISICSTSFFRVFPRTCQGPWSRRPEHSHSSTSHSRNQNIGNSR